MEASSESIGATIEQAWAAVEPLNLPLHVQGHALQAAAEMLRDVKGPTVGKQGGRGSTGIGDAGKLLHPPGGGENLTVDGGTFFRAMVEGSGLTGDDLARLYVVTDGSVRIAARRTQLGSSEADKLRGIAMLLLGARYFADGEKDLPVAAVRTAAKDLKQDTGTNLLKNLSTVPGTTMTNVGLRVVESKFHAAYIEAARAILGEE